MIRLSILFLLFKLHEQGMKSTSRLKKNYKGSLELSPVSDGVEGNPWPYCIPIYDI